MCKTLFVINEQRLGKRSEGYQCYNAKDFSIEGYTAKDIKNLINTGNTVYGFILNKEGELELDKNFITSGIIMVKSGINTLKPIDDTIDCNMTVLYTVVRQFKGVGGKNEYEVINSKFARTTISEERLKLLIELNSVNGASVNDKGKINICNGVEVVDNCKEEIKSA